jgi:hypothetical protein
MKSKRTILRFVLIAALIYGIFAIPFSWIDEGYGKFYRATGKLFFSHFAGSGFARFSSTEDPELTKINIGNYSQKQPNGGIRTKSAEFSTRDRGYLPTLLLLTLIFASPVPKKRKLVAILAGFIIIMVWIITKQWIHILRITSENPWLGLFDFSATRENILLFLYNGIVFSLTPSFTFAVIAWFLVTFRIEDISLISSKN